MSMFSAMMGDLEDDPIFGHHMRQMRQMNNMMNSLFADPFQMFGGGGNPMGMLTNGPTMAMPGGQRQLLPMFSNNLSNRLLNADFTAPNDGVSFCSSSVFSMSSGPDGKPQVYQASSSTKTGPNGVRETRKTLQDSRSGTKKMAIGHHIGERAHVIEKSQDLSTGQIEENEELINLDEEEKDNFNREFTHKLRALGGRRTGPEIRAITSGQDSDDGSEQPKAFATTISPNRRPVHASSRRPIRPVSSPLALKSSGNHITTTSVHPHPYQTSSSRKQRPIKGPSTYNQHHHQH